MVCLCKCVYACVYMHARINIHHRRVYMAWRGVVWCDAVLCVCVVWCGAVRMRGVVWCGAVRCGAVLCGAVRCGAVRCCAWCGAVRGAVLCVRE